MSLSKIKYRIVAINGSVRYRNFTLKVLSLVIDELKKNKAIGVDLIKLTENELVRLAKSDKIYAASIQKLVQQATGIILATPEYHGSFSGAVKLVIDNLGFPSVLAGKPVALLGVASGQIGAIKALEHLRSVCSHVGSIVLPSPVSVPNVTDMFDKKGRCLDKKMEARIRGLAHGLIHYIEENICPRKILEKHVIK